MRNDSVLGGRKEKKKKDCPRDSPQTCGEMYVLEKMTQQRALIAVMTHRQPHGFHKWEAAFQPEKNEKKPSRGVEQIHGEGFRC